MTSMFFQIILHLSTRTHRDPCMVVRALHPLSGMGDTASYRDIEDNHRMTYRDIGIRDDEVLVTIAIFWASESSSILRN